MAPWLRTATGSTSHASETSRVHGSRGNGRNACNVAIHGGDGRKLGRTSAPMPRGLWGATAGAISRTAGQGDAGSVTLPPCTLPRVQGVRAVSPRHEPARAGAVYDGDGNSLDVAPIA